MTGWGPSRSEFSSESSRSTPSATTAQMKQLLVAAIIVCFAFHLEISSGFEESSSFVALHYAWAAFCPVQNLTDWNCEWCLPDFQFEQMLLANATDTYGYVGYDQTRNTIYVAFRGTQGWKNIFVDLQFYTVEEYASISGARVHAGFYRAYEAVKLPLHDAIHRILTSKCPQCRTIVFTGHSLGAALSGLAALDIAMMLEDLHLADSVTVRLNNFGMPRVGNKEFAEGFGRYVKQENSWRLVHDKDIVPHLPPRDAGFHQVWTEIWNKDDVHSIGAESSETYVVCDASGEDPTCSDSIGVGYSPADHMFYMGVHNSNCGQSP